MVMNCSGKVYARAVSLMGHEHLFEFFIKQPAKMVHLGHMLPRGLIETIERVGSEAIFQR